LLRASFVALVVVFAFELLLGRGFAQPPHDLTPAVPASANGAPHDQPPVGRQPLSFWQIVFSGGPLGIAIMAVLIGLSITALALAADDLRIVQKSRIIPDGLSDEIRDLVAAGELGMARSRCKAHPSFLAAVVMHGLNEIDGGWPEVQKAMEDATAEQAARLFRRIEYLSVIGNIAPMVGLLGTVTGMLLAFKQVADTEGHAGAAQLADGIYQALVTTVVGLIIAIPSLGAFALFRSRVDQLVAEAAYAALHALSPLKQRGTSVPAIEPPPVPAYKSDA
jgi:biopolymer transport protein ExbB